MTILFIQYGLDQDTTLFIYLGFWLLITVITFVAAYGLWWREYNSKVKAIIYSCLAITLTFLALSSLNFLFYGYYTIYGLKDILSTLITIHMDLFGLPYIGAIIVGWFFARPAPDLRESF